jgi:hypothetical protein
MNFPYLLALLGNTAGKGEGSRYLPYLKDPLLVVLAIIPLAVGVFIWAKARSRQRRRHKRHGHRISAKQSQALVESWKVMHGSRGRRKHHHRRETTNPTLADTGGLPPRRAPGTAPASSDLPPPPVTVPPLPYSGTVPPNPPEPRE